MINSAESRCVIWLNRIKIPINMDSLLEAYNNTIIYIVSNKHHHFIFSQSWQDIQYSHSFWYQKYQKSLANVN